jgi:hypothetical protein
MFNTARRLSLRQWRYLVASLLLLPRVEYRLRKRGYVYARMWVDQKAEKDMNPPFNGDDIAFSKEVATAVGIAARRTLGSSSCLRQALVLRYFLAREQIDSELRIGVRGGRRDFAAHAWVERHGVVLIGGEYAGERYVALT